MVDRNTTRRGALRTAGGLGTIAIAGGGVPVVGAQDHEDEGESNESDSQANQEEQTKDVFIACRLDNSVAVMEPETKQITDVIPVGKQPLYVSVAPDGQYAYAPNTQSNNVTVIDAQEKEAIKTIPLESSPNGVNVHPGSGDAFVEVGSGGQQVAVIDNESLEVRETIATGKGPHNIVFDPRDEADPEGGFAYVTLQRDAAIGVIDLDCLQMVDTIKDMGHPHNIHIDTVNNRVYVANIQNELAIIDTEKREVIQKRPLTDGNADIHATLDGQKILVSGVQSDAITVHTPNDDFTDYRITDIITIWNEGMQKDNTIDREYIKPGLGPHGCFVSPYRNEAYVTHTGRDQLVVIDMETHEITHRVDTPAYPFFSDQQYEYGN